MTDITEQKFKEWFKEKFHRNPGESEFDNALRAAFRAGYGFKLQEEAVDEVFRKLGV